MSSFSTPCAFISSSRNWCLGKMALQLEFYLPWFSHTDGGKLVYSSRVQLGIRPQFLCPGNRGSVRRGTTSPPLWQWSTAGAAGGILLCTGVRKASRALSPVVTNVTVLGSYRSQGSLAPESSFQLHSLIWAGTSIEFQFLTRH